MRKKAKIVIFIGVVVLIIICVCLAPYGLRNNLIAIGGTSLGFIGAAIAGISRRRSGGSTTIADADKRAADVERENRAAVGSMDSVSISGESLRVTGEQLVNTGDKLVESSQSLIDELRSGDKNTATGA